jgi:thymidylate kinase
MLESFKELIDSLFEAKVLFCHWKSNDRLKDALLGREDLDLLVSPKQINLFESILLKHSFRKAIKLNSDKTPCIQHFYSIDKGTGILLHVHVYYRIITGGSILKNYHLSVEEKFLKSCNLEQGIPVPRRSTDLIFLCIRKFLEYGSIIETIINYRERAILKKEILYLLEKIDIKDLPKEAISYFPHLDPNFFGLCLQELVSPTHPLKRLRLGYKMQKYLCRFSLNKYMISETLRILKLTKMIFKKLCKLPRPTTLEGGGYIIAITGADATGKSTIVKEITDWLGAELWCENAHTGLPPSTLLSFIPRSLLPFLKRLLPSYKTTALLSHVQKDKKTLVGMKLILFSIRSLMIAYDRLSFCSSIFSKSRKGAFIICDRYPSQVPGAMDSAQLDPSSPTVKNSIFAQKFSKLEENLYSRIPLPDIVIRLTVPLEIAIKRNRDRYKKGKDSEDYIRERHALPQKSIFGNKEIFLVDTNKGMDETLKEIKKIIWSAL